MAKPRSNSIWWPRYVGDYQRKTSHLSLVEHGAYVMLLDHYYSTGKPLPANAPILHRVCRAFASDEQDAVQSVLDQFFVLEPDGYHNRKADEELAKRGDITKKRADAANARHEKARANAGANAGANAHTTTATTTYKKDSPPLGTPPTEITASGNPMPKTEGHDDDGRSKRGSRLKADWCPSGDDLAFASSLGLDATGEADKFRDYWLAQPGQKGVKLDWTATWRNWCRRSAERPPSGKKPQGGGGCASSVMEALRWNLNQPQREIDVFGRRIRNGLDDGEGCGPGSGGTPTRPR